MERLKIRDLKPVRELVQQGQGQGQEQGEMERGLAADEGRGRVRDYLRSSQQLLTCLLVGHRFHPSYNKNAEVGKDLATCPSQAVYLLSQAGFGPSLWLCNQDTHPL